MALTESLWLLLAVALLISVLTDLKDRRILDVVTYPTFSLALLLRAWREGAGDVERGLVSGLVGGLAAGLLFAVLAWRGQGFGWGDVKLMAVVGAVFGYPLVLSALVFISLAGALQAVVALIWQGAVWDTLARGMQRVGEKLKVVKPATEKPAKRHIPYAVAIALGSAWAMWWDRKG